MLCATGAQAHGGVGDAAEHLTRERGSCSILKPTPVSLGEKAAPGTWVVPGSWQSAGAGSDSEAERTPVVAALAISAGL